jgi:hypothetical protein
MDTGEELRWRVLAQSTRLEAFPLPARHEPDGLAAGDGADAASAAEPDKTVDVAAAMNIAEAEAPALAPEPFSRDYPAEPHAVRRSGTGTMLEQARRWLGRVFTNRD